MFLSHLMIYFSNYYFINITAICSNFSFSSKNLFFHLFLSIRTIVSFLRRKIVKNYPPFSLIKSSICFSPFLLSEIVSEYYVWSLHMTFPPEDDSVLDNGEPYRQCRTFFEIASMFFVRFQELRYCVQQYSKMISPSAISNPHGSKQTEEKNEGGTPPNSPI